MAAPINRLVSRRAYQQFRALNDKFKHVSFSICAKCNSNLSQQSVKGKSSQNAEVLFTSPAVQNILQKVTGFQLEKIFRSRLASDVAPTYKLVTEKQFKEMQDDAVERGKARLQMPPFKEPWNQEFEVLSEDAGIDLYDTANCKYVFTDITKHVPHPERTVVVRESDGTLRTAKAEERDRMTQVYFPCEGRMYHVPAMFQQEKLQTLLEEDPDYEYILDRACVQFEPDDPEYTRVTEQVYDHVEQCKKYCDLWSSRHFGVLTFYLARKKQIDRLLQYMIQENRLDDATALVQLYILVHPDGQLAKEAGADEDPAQLLQGYIKTEAKEKGPIMLALQSYFDKKSQ